MTRHALHAALVSTFLLAGCTAKNNAATTIDNAQSQEAGKTLAASIEDSASGFGPADSGTSFAALPACATISGDVSDADGDHIPANATITYSNCTQNGPNATAVFNGTETVKDTQPAAAAFAAQLTIDGTLVVTANAGNASVSAHRTGAITASTNGLSYSLAHDKQTTVDAQGAGQTYHADENYQLTSTYTPGGTWTPGTPAVAGTINIAGSWDATVQNASASSTVSTVSPLSYDPTCATKIGAGEIQATFSGPNSTRTLDVTWTSCGTRAVVYTETPN